MSKQKAAARVADPTEHEGTIVKGAPKVLINGQPAARVTDYHLCPVEVDGIEHVGGVIVEGSSHVFIASCAAARVGDALACDRQPVPKSVLEELVREESIGAKLGAEIKKIGVVKRKLAKNLVDAKGIISYKRFQGQLEGPAGSLTPSLDVGKFEGRFSLGESDNLRGGTRYGGEVALGFAAIEGKGVYKSPLLPIPFTGYGIGVEAEAMLSLLAIEGKLEAGLIFRPGELRLVASEKLSAGVGEGLKGALVIKSLKPEAAPEMPVDRIKEGSPNVFIGD